MVKREAFDPERGWIEHEKIIEELENKAKLGKLNEKEVMRLAGLKSSREFSQDKPKTGQPPLPADWRPGNYL